MVDAAITKGTRRQSSTKYARTGTLNFCFQVSITIAKKIRHLQVCLLRQQPIHLRYQIQFGTGWLSFWIPINEENEKNRWTKVGQKLWYDKNGDNLCAKGGAHIWIMYLTMDQSQPAWATVSVGQDVRVYVCVCLRSFLPPPYSKQKAL